MNKLICPACNKILSVQTVGHLTVDFCAKGCGGIWFDNFELEQAAELHEVVGEVLVQLENKSPIIQAPSETSDKRLCPRCENTKMMRHYFSSKRQVIVDQCSSCNGYWLDSGELSNIREETAKSTSGEGLHLDATLLSYIYNLQIQITKKSNSGGHSRKE
jgi:hypothetical protein